MRQIGSLEKSFKRKYWTDTLISLVVHAPIDKFKFTAGQFAKLALEIDGERRQRA